MRADEHCGSTAITIALRRRRRVLASGRFARLSRSGSSRQRTWSDERHPVRSVLSNVAEENDRAKKASITRPSMRAFRASWPASSRRARPRASVSSHRRERNRGVAPHHFGRVLRRLELLQRSVQRSSCACESGCSRLQPGHVRQRVDCQTVTDHGEVEVGTRAVAGPI